MIEQRCLPPLFDIDESFEIRQSAFLALAGLCLLLLINKVASKPDGPGELEWLLSLNPWSLEFLCGATLFILLPLLLLSGGIKGLVDGKGITAKKKRWIKAAASNQAPIIDRKEEHDPYGETMEDLFPCYLALQLPAEMCSEPGGQVLWVRVSGVIYARYRQKNTARIYYSAMQPNVFILEGE